MRGRPADTAHAPSWQGIGGDELTTSGSNIVAVEGRPMASNARSIWDPLDVAEWEQQDDQARDTPEATA